MLHVTLYWYNISQSYCFNFRGYPWTAVVEVTVASELKLPNRYIGTCTFVLTVMTFLFVNASFGSKKNYSCFILTDLIGYVILQNTFNGVLYFLSCVNPSINYKSDDKLQVQLQVNFYTFFVISQRVLYEFIPNSTGL